jgi:hypothetical protein
VLLAIPGVIWWRDSVLFVILISLATQAWTSIGAAEAADDSELRADLRHIRHQLNALLEQTKARRR